MNESALPPAVQVLQGTEHIAKPTQEFRFCACEWYVKHDFFWLRGHHVVVLIFSVTIILTVEHRAHKPQGRREYV